MTRIIILIVSLIIAIPLGLFGWAVGDWLGIQAYLCGGFTFALSFVAVFMGLSLASVGGGVVDDGLDLE